MSLGKSLLWMALLATVVAALWPLPEDKSAGRTADGVLPQGREVRKHTTPPGEASTPQLRALSRTNSSMTSPGRAQGVDLFPSQDWTAPPPSAAPEVPTAPALPFAYGGRYTEGGRVFVFLKEGEKMQAARQGDTVNATYRIDKISTAEITLTYLPLGIQQILVTGSTTSP